MTTLSQQKSAATSNIRAQARAATESVKQQAKSAISSVKAPKAVNLGAVPSGIQTDPSVAQTKQISDWKSKQLASIATQKESALTKLDLSYKKALKDQALQSSESSEIIPEESVLLKQGYGVDEINRRRLLAAQLAAEEDFAKDMAESTSGLVQVAGNQYLSKSDWDALSTEDQTLINKIGVNAYNKVLQERSDLENRRLMIEASSEASKFKDTHFQISDDKWLPNDQKEFWSGLTDSQKQEVITTGTYTVPGTQLSTVEQFNSGVAGGTIPSNAVFLGGSESGGVKYIVPPTNTELSAYVDSAGGSKNYFDSLSDAKDKMSPESYGQALQVQASYNNSLDNPFPEGTKQWYIFALQSTQNMDLADFILRSGGTEAQVQEFFKLPSESKTQYLEALSAVQLAPIISSSGTRVIGYQKDLTQGQAAVMYEKYMSGEISKTDWLNYLDTVKAKNLEIGQTISDLDVPVPSFPALSSVVAESAALNAQTEKITLPGGLVVNKSAYESLPGNAIVTGVTPEGNIQYVHGGNYYFSEGVLYNSAGKALTDSKGDPLPWVSSYQIALEKGYDTSDWRVPEGAIFQDLQNYASGRALDIAIRNASESLESQLGRVPTLQEMHSALGVPEPTFPGSVGAFFSGVGKDFQSVGYLLTGQGTKAVEAATEGTESIGSGLQGFFGLSSDEDFRTRITKVYKATYPEESSGAGFVAANVLNTLGLPGLTQPLYSQVGFGDITSQQWLETGLNTLLYIPIVGKPLGAAINYGIRGLSRVESLLPAVRTADILISPSTVLSGVKSVVSLPSTLVRGSLVVQGLNKVLYTPIGELASSFKTGLYNSVGIDLSIGGKLSKPFVNPGEYLAAEIGPGRIATQPLYRTGVATIERTDIMQPLYQRVLMPLRESPVGSSLDEVFSRLSTVKQGMVDSGRLSSTEEVISDRLASEAVTYTPSIGSKGASGLERIHVSLDPKGSLVSKVIPDVVKASPSLPKSSQYLPSLGTPGQVTSLVGAKTQPLYSSVGMQPLYGTFGMQPLYSTPGLAPLYGISLGLARSGGLQTESLASVLPKLAVSPGFGLGSSLLSRIDTGIAGQPDFSSFPESLVSPIAVPSIGVTPSQIVSTVPMTAAEINAAVQAQTGPLTAAQTNQLTSALSGVEVRSLTDQQVQALVQSLVSELVETSPYTGTEALTETQLKTSTELQTEVKPATELRQGTDVPVTELGPREYEPPVRDYIFRRTPDDDDEDEKKKKKNRKKVRQTPGYLVPYPEVSPTLVLHMPRPLAPVIEPLRPRPIISKSRKPIGRPRVYQAGFTAVRV